MVALVMFNIFFTINKSETHRHCQREIYLYRTLRRCAILGNLCDANFIYLVTMIQETACDSRKMSVVSDVL